MTVGLRAATARQSWQDRGQYSAPRVFRPASRESRHCVAQDVIEEHIIVHCEATANDGLICPEQALEKLGV